MREKVSYDNYYNGERTYVRENKKGVGLLGVCMVAAGAGVAGYVLGYKKARGTAKGIFNIVLSKCTDEKQVLKDIWNEAVDEYFDKK